MNYNNNDTAYGFVPFNFTPTPFNPSAGNLLLKGKVIDMSTNEPLSAAHVYYLRNGIKIGVITNIRGEYELQASPTDIIIISFLGYKISEVLASKIEAIEYLEPYLEELKEVVITGTKKTKNNNMLYVGLGLLVLIGVVMTTQDKKTT